MAVSVPLAVPALIAAVVGTVCAVLALASWRALVRTGNRGIYFIVAAFGVLALKGFIKSLTLSTGGETAAVELAFSFMDLATVTFFAWPLLRRVGGLA